MQAAAEKVQPESDAGPPPEPEPVAPAEEISGPEGILEPPTEDEDASPGEAEPRVDPGAELKVAEEEVRTILTGVLDRLGAAHHRPFSRS